MFTLTIETDNDDFRYRNSRDAVAELLRLVIRDLYDGSREGKVHDLNGNTAGSFTLTED